MGVTWRGMSWILFLSEQKNYFSKNKKSFRNIGDKDIVGLKTWALKLS